MRVDPKFGDWRAVKRTNKRNPWFEVQETAFNMISVRRERAGVARGARSRRTHARGAEFPAGVAERESEKGRERVGRALGVRDERDEGRWYRRSLARTRGRGDGRARPSAAEAACSGVGTSGRSVVPFSRASAVGRKRSRESAESTSKAAARQERRRSIRTQLHARTASTGRGGTNEARNGGGR